MAVATFATWVRYIGPITAIVVAIAAIVGVIFSWLQWRSARQRAALDPAGGRTKIVEELLGIVAEMVREGKVRRTDTDRFGRAMKGAQFLFGQEVMNYLHQTRRVLVELETIDSLDEKTEQTLDKRQALRNELAAFVDKFQTLVKPYVQMDQKR